MSIAPPLGISDFRSLRQQGLTCVDKTATLADILRNPAQVLLFPRPRRSARPCSCPRCRRSSSAAMKIASRCSAISPSGTTRPRASTWPAIRSCSCAVESRVGPGASRCPDPSGCPGKTRRAARAQGRAAGPHHARRGPGPGPGADRTARLRRRAARGRRPAHPRPGRGLRRQDRARAGWRSTGLSARQWRPAGPRACRDGVDRAAACPRAFCNAGDRAAACPLACRDGVDRAASCPAGLPRRG